MQKNKMKRLFLILIIFIIFIVIADVIAYLFIRNQEKAALKVNNLEYLKLPPYFYSGRFVKNDYSSVEFFYNDPKSPGFRKPNGLEYKQKAIWLFGDSFAYGSDMSLPDGLANEKTFAAKLSNAAKRPVYNRAYQGWGIQHMLYQLEDPKTFEELPEPEYVIFFHTTNNTYKLVNFTYGPWCSSPYLRYKLDKNGKLYRIKPIFKPLYYFYFTKLYFNFMQYKVILTEKHFDKNFDVIKAIFLESARIIHEHYPNAKFIILKYDEINEFDTSYFYSPRWKEIEKEGIIILDAAKLVNADLKSKDYVCNDNYHQSEKANDELSAALAAKLKSY